MTTLRQGRDPWLSRRDMRVWCRPPVMMALLAAYTASAIACGNTTPIASDRAVTLDEDESYPIVLGASDGDGDSLSWYVVVNPQHGSLEGTAPNLTYTPDANYFGLDAFTYKVNDGIDDSNVAIVAIRVEGVPDVPTANARTIRLSEDMPQTFQLTGRDHDGDKLEFSIVQQPERGTLDAEESPTVTYTPDQDFTGRDRFTFRVTDGEHESEVATMTLQVEAVNDPPDPTERTVRTAEDTPVNFELAGVDPEGSDVSVFLIAAPQHGTLHAAALPVITYTPDLNFVGEDFVTFIASDGERESEPANITIIVTEIDDPPTVSDLAVSVSEDNPLVFELPVSDVDTPIEELRATLLELPVNGRLFERDGADAITTSDLPLPLDDLSLLYVPPTDFYSPGNPPVAEVFDIEVSDGENASTGTVYLVVFEGSIVYVSPDGDDAFDGRTENRPMRTIAAALRRTDIVSEFETPDTLRLDAGRYCESGLELLHSVRISGVDMETTIIDGSVVGGNCDDARTDEFHSTMLATCEVRIQSDWPSEGVFRVSADGRKLIDVEFSDLTITNGTNTSYGGAIYNTERLALQRVRLHNNCSSRSGGALANVRPETVPVGEEHTDWGEAILSDCEVIGNGALRGGGLSNTGVMGLRETLVAENEAILSGGGVYCIEDEIIGDASSLSLLAGSEVSLNRALRHGGGLYVTYCDLGLLESAVDSNVAGVLGDDGLAGGVYAIGRADQPFSFVSSSISQNSAPFFGGMYLEGYEVAIGDSQLNDNHAEQAYGGAYILGEYSTVTSVGIFGGTEIRGNDSDGDHAGLTLEGVDAMIVQTVIADNAAEGEGGGVSVRGSRVLFEQVEVTENQAAIGGGILVGDGALLELENTNVTLNVASELGGGLAQLSGRTMIADTTVFDGNMAQPRDAEIDNEIQRGGGIGVNGGAMHIEGALITNNESADWGGGVYSAHAELFLEAGTQITANRAMSAGTDVDLLDGAVPAGGGVYFSEGGLTSSLATISGNRSEVLGGGLASVFAIAHIESTVISANSAHADVDSGAGREVQKGGGLYTDGTEFLIVDSVFSDNYTTDHGGGVYLARSTGVILRSEFSENSASEGDDPVGDAFAQGGGLYITSAGVSIFNSTVASNWSDWDGSGIMGVDSDIDLFYDTVTLNSTGAKGALANQDTDWVFHGLVVGNNLPGGDCEGMEETISGYSLDSDDTCMLGPFDLEQDNPFLADELVDNGGFSRTVFVLDGSPLIDAIPTEECLFQYDAFGIPLTDQRSEGYLRPVGAGCDVGALERQ